MRTRRIGTRREYNVEREEEEEEAGQRGTGAHEESAGGGAERRSRSNRGVSGRGCRGHGGRRRCGRWPQSQERAQGLARGCVRPMRSSTGATSPAASEPANSPLPSSPFTPLPHVSTRTVPSSTPLSVRSAILKGPAPFQKARFLRLHRHAAHHLARLRRARPHGRAAHGPRRALREADGVRDCAPPRPDAPRPGLAEGALSPLPAHGDRKRSPQRDARCAAPRRADERVPHDNGRDDHRLRYCLRVEGLAQRPEEALRRLLRREEVSGRSARLGDRPHHPRGSSRPRFEACAAAGCGSERARRCMRGGRTPPLAAVRGQREAPLVSSEPARTDCALWSQRAGMRLRARMCAECNRTRVVWFRIAESLIAGALDQAVMADWQSVVPLQLATLTLSRHSLTLTRLRAYHQSSSSVLTVYGDVVRRRVMITARTVVRQADGLHGPSALSTLIRDGSQ